MPMSATISTARLDLVPLRVADAVEMTGVLADPALYAVTGGRPPSRAELEARYLVQVAGHSTDGRETWHNWIVRERARGSAVGFVQATIVAGQPAGREHDGAVAEIAWVIGTPWQGRGYASEAALSLVAWLEAAGIATIEAHVAPDHAASAAVARKAGLAPTDALVDGEVVWRRRVRSSGRAG